MVLSRLCQSTSPLVMLLMHADISTMDLCRRSWLLFASQVASGSQVWRAGQRSWRAKSGLYLAVTGRRLAPFAPESPPPPAAAAVARGQRRVTLMRRACTLGLYGHSASCITRIQKKHCGQRSTAVAACMHRASAPWVVASRERGQCRPLIASTIVPLCCNIGVSKCGAHEESTVFV